MSSAHCPPPDSGNYQKAEALNTQYDPGQLTQQGSNSQYGVVGQADDKSSYVEQLFSYHPANPSTGPKYDNIREAAKYFAKVIIVNTPPGSDRSAAIRKLREAVMTANAGIALGGLSL